jgi:hypothetical protein
VISVAAQLRAGAFTLFADVTQIGSASRKTGALFVLPDSPRLAVDPARGPAIRVIRYLREDGSAWGSLELTLDLGWRPEEEAEILAVVAPLLASEGIAAGEIELRPMPAHAGRVTLGVLGEGEGDEGQVAGVAELALVGSERASFVATLDGEGAALLLAALRTDALALTATWELAVHHRMEAVRVRVWADVSGLSLPDEPEAAVASLVAGSRGGVSVDAGEGLALSPAEEARLSARGLELLAAFVARAREGGPASLRVEWTGDALMERVISTSAPLRVELTEAEAAERLREIRVEPGFFDVTEVRVLAPAWSQESPVVSVHLRLSHGAAPNETMVEHLFGAEGGEARFRAQARTEEEQVVRAEARVRYRGRDEALELAPRELTAGELWVLEPAYLGVFGVVLELGRLHEAEGGSAEVEVELPGVNFRRVEVLDRARREARVEAVVADGPTEDARLRVTWHLADGGRVEEGWRPLAPGRFLLDAPREEPPREVIFMSAGRFDGVASLVVEVRPEEAAETDATLGFTAPGQERAWRVRAPAGEPARCATRQTTIYSDGTRRTEDWHTSDALLRVVRDRSLMEVRVDGRFLDLGGSLRAALVELSYDDPESGASSRKSLVLSAPDAAATWSFRLGAPERRTWRWRVTWVDSERERVTSAWQDSREDVLVLPRPTNPPI